MRAALRVALAAAAIALMTGLSASPAAASGAVPYNDPNAIGYIGLCNKAGQQITHGSIHTSPLAWRAVSSVAAQSPYNGPGRTATLYAYQPRRGLLPSEWSGEAITASSRYSNPAHPMVAPTIKDGPLYYFTGDFHPAWDGLVQLRIYLGVPNNAPYTYKYPALNLKVTGNTWHVVDGGHVSCHSGTSVSIESILLHPTSSPAAGSHHSSHPKAGASAKANGSAKPTGAGQATRSAGVAPSTSEAASSESSGSSSHGGLIAFLIVIAALVVAAAIYLFSRRRRPAPAGHSSPSTDDHSTKGQS